MAADRCTPTYASRKEIAALLGIRPSALWIRLWRAERAAGRELVQRNPLDARLLAVDEAVAVAMRTRRYGGRSNG